MNKALLIGNLSRDPDYTTTPNGTPVCRFTLAVQRRFPDASGKRHADFLNVVAWRQLADLCGRYLAKGRKAAVIGEIQTRSYDAQDGTKRYITEIIADEVQFLSPVNAGQHDGNSNAPDAPPPGFEPVDDDEMPF